MLENRYDFVILFDVENGNPMAIQMQAIAHAWMRRQGLAM